MKLLAITFMFVSTWTIAQVAISPKTLKPTLFPGNIEPEDYALLKNSKTIFIYSESDTVNTDVEAFEKMLKDAWTCTKELVPMTLGEYREFQPEGGVRYSIWSISTIKKTITSEKGSVVERDFVCLRLSLTGEHKNKFFARVDFYPVSSATPKYADNFYQYAELHNWYAGYLKNMLQEVSHYITIEEERSYFERGSTEEVGQLKTNTLYIPEYALIKFNKRTGDESEKHDLAKLFGRYKFDHKVVSTQELSDMILDSTKTIYYFSYVKSSTHLFYNIINSQTGEIVYSFYKGNHYNLQPKRIAKLQRAVKRNS